MGMDAGVGRLYAEQLNVGVPDKGFDERVRLLLTEEAGLNDKAASELAGYFDEMIGWRPITEGKTERQTGASQRPSAEKKEQKNPEITRPGNHSGSDPQKQQAPNGKAAQSAAQSAAAETADPAVSGTENGTTTQSSGCAVGIVSLLIFAASVALTVYVSPVFMILMIPAFFVGIGNFLALFKKKQ